MRNDPRGDRARDKHSSTSSAIQQEGQISFKEITSYINLSLEKTISSNNHFVVGFHQLHTDLQPGLCTVHSKCLSSQTENECMTSDTYLQFSSKEGYSLLEEGTSKHLHTLLKKHNKLSLPVSRAKLTLG